MIAVIYQLLTELDALGLIICFQKHAHHPVEQVNMVIQLITYVKIVGQTVMCVQMMLHVQPVRLLSSFTTLLVRLVVHQIL